MRFGLNRLAWALPLLFVAACGPVDVRITPRPPAPTPDPALVEAIERDCADLYRSELEREIDPVGLTGCRARGLAGEPGWQESVRTFLQSTPEYADRQAAKVPPIDRDGFLAQIAARQYQGNFGTIKLPGCGLHMDSLFDPFLLIKWIEDRPCFERMMQAHMDRGDNVVAVDPRSGYHGHNDVDLWHQPDLFAAFLKDVRQHRNKYGEFIRVHVFMGGDGHIDSMLAPGALEHWTADVNAMAAAAEPVIDSTVPCWECRHDPSQSENPWVNARVYIAMAKHLAATFPRAVHAQHLISGSSSWSMWRCDPQQAGSCANPGDGPPRADADDPNRGNEAGAWAACRREGWCDVLLFQFEVGNSYLYPESEPNYTGHPGALGRWFEVAVRLGDDAQSRASSGGDRHGWVQAPVIAFEFIYDTHWMRDPKATEAYAVEFCKRALAIGGSGCGSASWRP